MASASNRTIFNDILLLISTDSKSVDLTSLAISFDKIDYLLWIKEWTLSKDVDAMGRSYAFISENISFKGFRRLLSSPILASNVEIYAIAIFRFASLYSTLLGKILT